MKILDWKEPKWNLISFELMSAFKGMFNVIGGGGRVEISGSANIIGGMEGVYEKDHLNYLLIMYPHP